MPLRLRSNGSARTQTTTHLASVDFREGALLDASDSPDAKNMLTGPDGLAKKRTGYRICYQASDSVRINGLFSYRNHLFMHQGTELYMLTEGEDGALTASEPILSGLSDMPSRGFTFGGAYYLLAGRYVRISYDETFGQLCVGTVSEAYASYQPDDAATLIEGRYKNSLGGGTVPACRSLNSAFQKVSFSHSVYYFSGGDGGDGDRLYITDSTDSTDTVVAGLYMNLSDGDTYTAIKPYQYRVERDSTGLCVVLHRTTSEIDASLPCSPYVLVCRLGEVAAPLLVTGREAVGISAVGIGEAEVDPEAVRFSGSSVDAVNMAARLRTVQFHYDATVQTEPAIRLYLEPEIVTGCVLKVEAAGLVLWQDTIREDGADKTVLHKLYAQRVDIDTAYLRQVTGLNSCDITVTYLATPTGGLTSPIDRCRIFGIYGADNDTRVFVAGDSEHIARDYQSGLYDGTYFPDTGYTTVGADASAIVGYHKRYQSQIIIKDGAAQDAACYLRTQQLVDGVSMYPVVQGTSGPGAANASCVLSAGSAQLFLSEAGVYELLATNVANQNNLALRSEKLGSRLTQESLADAVGAVHDGRYWVICDTHAYVYEPESKAWSYLDALPAISCVLSQDALLWFGTADGRVGRFMREGEANCYYDNVAADGSIADAQAIDAYWSTPLSNLKLDDRLKTVEAADVCVWPQGSVVHGSVRVLFATDTEPYACVLAQRADLFDFREIDFRRFSFKNVRTPFALTTRLHRRCVYLFSLRVQNDEPGEGLCLQRINIRFRPAGYVR